MIALKSFIITWKEQVFLAIFIEIKKERRYFYPSSYFWRNPLGVVNCPTPSNFALIGNTLLLLSFCFLFYHVNWRCPSSLHTAMTKNVKQIKTMLSENPIHWLKPDYVVVFYQLYHVIIIVLCFKDKTYLDKIIKCNNKVLLQIATQLNFPTLCLVFSLNATTNIIVKRSLLKFLRTNEKGKRVYLNQNQLNDNLFFLFLFFSF